jgi:endonuclease/exonuclease/phosphatase family metal-dependent hydrolase
MQAAFQRNISFGFGGYGNAILVRPVILHYRCHRLPGKGEPRGLLQVTANLNGENIVIFCTHLSTDRDTRIYQAKHVREIIKSVPGPKILCGDMNDVRGSQTIFELLDETVLRDVAVEAGADNIPTFSTGDPRRVDFIFADIRFVVKSYQVVESNDSDHKPVVADLELP